MRDRWTPLGVTYEVPSIVENPVSLFLAQGDPRSAQRSPKRLKPIDVVRIPIEDAYRACADGRIDDAVTLAALLRYRLLSERTVR